MRNFSQPGSGRGWEQLSAGALVAAMAMMLEEPGGEPVERSFFIALVIFAGALIAYQLLAPSPQFEDARPAGLSEFTFPTTTQDRPVPIVVGTVRQRGPNVNWYGDFEQRAVTEEITSGFFQSEEIVRGFQYFVGISFAVCRGDDATPVELRRIWINEDEVFSGSITGEGSLTVDEPELFGGQELGQGGVQATVSWRPGTTTQTVNTYLDNTGEQKIPPTTGQTPRYTGVAYAMVEKGYIGNTTTVAPWSFEVRRIPNGLGLVTPTVNSGNDANLMNWAFEILTNQEWGYKFPSADIDIANFTSVAATLAGESNGISMIIDAEIDASAMLDEAMRQMGGVIFLDHRTGLWTAKLARDDYDIDTIPQLTSPLEVSQYKTGDWTDTTNIVTTAFVNRADDYNEDTASAQNMANALIQGDGTVLGGRAVPGNVRYPGVKTSQTATDIATRELMLRSRPLIQAKIAVTREFWDVTPGSVIAWTDDRHEGQKIPFRITKINYGRLRAEAIVLEIIEDVFRFTAGIFGAPPPTMWSPPQGVPVAFPTAEQLAIESPRGISSRAPAGVQSYLMCMGRRQNFATKFQIWQRNHPTTPSSSSYAQLGSAFGFMLIGELVNALGEGTAIPTATIDIDPDPDIQADIEAAISDLTDPVNVGTNLLNLLMVGDEFMLAMSAADSGLNVRLSDVYRGVLDSVQGDHAAGAPIYILFGNVSSGPVPETNKCEVKLLPESAFGVVLLASATTITISRPGGTGMDKRNRRPYPPGRISLGGTVYATTASLEGNGSVPEDFGLDLDYIRRDYRTGDGGDEIAALTTDAATLFPSFPTFNNTTVEVEAIDDPDGSPTSLFTETGLTGTGTTVLRIEILAQTDGVLPTRMQLSLIQVHDEGPDNGLESRDAAFHDFDVTTALTGDFNFGARNQAVTSNQYTATVNGTYTFNLSTALPGGEDVEYSLNGGGWLQLIAGGGTGPGTIVGVVSTDTIDVRHQGTGSPLRKQLTMTAAGAGQDGYFILTG